MKKVSFILMLFLLCSGILVMNSCTKDEKVQEQESIQLNDGISITDGILTFATVDLYDETIQLLRAFNDEELNKWEKAYNYVSLRSLNAKPVLIKEIGNTFATLLNPEKEIIIAGNHFKLDFEKETITKQKWDESCELKSINENESNTFNFKDDVDIFEENPFLKSSSSACGHEGRLWFERNTLVNGHANYRLEYDSWSIFQHVRAEIEPDDYPVKVWLSINAGNENKWNPLNENYCSKLANNVSLGGTDGSSSNISYDMYDGTKRLSAYNFKVTFKARSQTSPYSDLDTWDVYLDCATVVCP